MRRTRLTIFLLIFLTSINLLRASYHWYSYVEQVGLVPATTHNSSGILWWLMLTGYLVFLTVTIPSAWTAMSGLVRVFWVAVTIQVILGLGWMFGDQSLSADNRHLLGAIQETVFSCLFGFLLIYYRKSKFDVFRDVAFGRMRRTPA